MKLLTIGDNDMFKKIRIKHLMEDFLKKYLPLIGLGEVLALRLECREIGRYIIVTEKGKYEIYVLDDVFFINIHEDTKYFERISFCIKERLGITIKPDELVLERNGIRQVVKLFEGNMFVYSKGNNEISNNYKCYDKPILNSEYLDIPKIMEKSKGFIYHTII